MLEMPVLRFVKEELTAPSKTKFVSGRPGATRLRGRQWRRKIGVNSRGEKKRMRTAQIQIAQ